MFPLIQLNLIVLLSKKSNTRKQKIKFETSIRRINHSDVQAHIIVTFAYLRDIKGEDSDYSIKTQ